MPATSAGALRHVRNLVAAQQSAAAPDSDLLERFTLLREESAFRALVVRHGPLVLGVCRRVLGNAHDAEDAFQATFLALARGAASIARRPSLAGWLYRVAYRTATRARCTAAGRKAREGQADRRSSADPLQEVTARELLAALDDELQRLSESHRAAVVLCHLEGLSCDDAARRLGCSSRTVKRRLEEGRRLLHARLERRGLALSAALLAAGVSQASARGAAAGLVGATVAAANAAGGTSPLLLAARVKAAAVLLLLGCGAALTLLTPSAHADPQPPAQQAKPEPARPPQARPEPGERLLIVGRVLTADGKPAAGADVAVLGHAKDAGRGGDLLSEQTHVLAQNKTDKEGRYKIDLPRPGRQHYHEAFLIARTAGHALAVRRLDPGQAETTADVRLSAEKPVSGRLLNLQGQPAAGVRVEVRFVRLSAEGDGDVVGVRFNAHPPELRAWPAVVTTDADGRFTMGGLAAKGMYNLAVSGEQFATQYLPTVEPEKAAEIRQSLAPAKWIEGRVLCGDTRKPVPHALLTVYATMEELGSREGLGARADAQGRFRVNPLPGKLFIVTAHPPRGMPYLAREVNLTWPAGAIKHSLDVELPRGVLVRGKITEEGSGKAVAGASVQYRVQRINNPNFRRDVPTGWQTIVPSGEDGTFSMAVLPGPGHLLIHGPGDAFVRDELPSRLVHEGRKGGQRYYCDAAVKLDPKAGDETKDVAVTLRRGVTVRGRLVGPKGEEVGDALMMCRYQVTALSPAWRFATRAAGGRFELTGCDPKREYIVYFLDPEKRWGTRAVLSAEAAAGKEVVVKLQPCGTAKARFVDPDGKAVPGAGGMLHFVLTPGPTRYDRKAYEKGELFADEDFLANLDRRNYWQGPKAGADGVCEFPALIPGATYRMVEFRKGHPEAIREFTAEAGKMLDLGKIRIEPQE